MHPLVDADWADVVRRAPDGLAVLDADGRWLRLNPAAEELCGVPAEHLVGSASPFRTTAGATGAQGLLDDDGAELVCTWSGGGPPAVREFAYRTHLLDAATGEQVVSFRDCTSERHRRRRVAALARASARLAGQGSVAATLDALAREVLRADALAGVQILSMDENGSGLRIMGSAGFPQCDDFFDRLLECGRRGARLAIFEAFGRQEPVVIPDRWAMLRDDPTWAPLRGYLSHSDWSWFASVPLTIRGRPAGVLNAYLAPGQVVGNQTLEFLTAMAEQAAVALDHADLLQAERELARREERQRLARDLHDSIVQQAFSIGMQAKVLGVVAARGDLPTDRVRSIAQEIGVLSQTVLADLRAMVHELRPLSSTSLGLQEALRALAESTTNRTGMRVTLQVGAGVDGLADEVSEDVYRIVAEALHNVVKHAEAGRVTVRVAVRGSSLAITVTDDGHGLPPQRPREGYGLTSMRERAEKWGGTLTVGPRARGGAGTSVRAVVPLPAPRRAQEGTP
ncbi:ATP-binding protein [Klenkia sp. PcliD-1-E]|uniref:sensor histidine kinase n=1 Tax=Klenkia sp. PcliD-1-E TaxID=2954492 RepID=UPI002097B256|nr:ATP-binding protein [Klenkia sp. PcliD-1-E]MCO7219720.1 histidine kinase [Klenkia sp. PcliD-1-E]